jgi:hypothetical protein
MASMMGRYLLIAAAFLSPLLTPAWAEEDANVVKGKLTAYGKNFVVVADEKIRLCKDSTLLDLEGFPITVDGLCATEAVAVTLSGNCAQKVQVTEIRR